MPVYTLGFQSFIELNRDGERGRPPDLAGLEVEVFQQPGVDGSAVRTGGYKGRPFQMRSCAIADNAAAAWSGFDAYNDMRGTGPWIIIWEGKDFSTSPLLTLYMVLDVGEFEVRLVGNLIVDGVVYGAKYLGYATWTLLPTGSVA